MSTPLNKADIGRAVANLAAKVNAAPKEQQTTIENEFNQTIPALSRQGVLTAARSLYSDKRPDAAATTTNQPNEMANAATETATEKPETGTTPAAAETKKRERGKNVVLNPKENNAHKVVMLVKQLAALGKLDGFSTVDLAEMRKTEKYAKKSDDELRDIKANAFEQFTRKFILNNGETETDKPLSVATDPRHEKALEVIRNAYKAEGEKPENQTATETEIEQDGKKVKATVNVADKTKVNMAMAKIALPLLAEIQKVYFGEGQTKAPAKPRAPKTFNDISFDDLLG